MEEEEELRHKITANYVKLGSALRAECNLVRDHLIQEFILDDADVERIDGLSTTRDKVDFMIKTVTKRKKCLSFFDLLQKIGFGKLCEEIKASDSGSYQRGHANIGDAGSQSSGRTKDQLEDLKSFLVERDTKQKEELKLMLAERDEEQKEELKLMLAERDEEQKEELKLMLAERDTKQKEELKLTLAERDEKQKEEWAKQDKRREDHLASIEKEYRNIVSIKDEMYMSLQTSYRSAKDKINQLTEVAKAKQLKITKLQKELDDAKRENEELKRKDKSGADINLQIKSFEEHIQRLEMDMERLKDDKLKVDEEFKIKENEITKLQQQTNDNLENKTRELSQVKSNAAATLVEKDTKIEELSLEIQRLNMLSQDINNYRKLGPKALRPKRYLPKNHPQPKKR